MKFKKINLFNFVNVLMVAFCICAIWMNHVGVKVLNTDTATSSINGDNFEYTVLDNSLEFKRNGNLIGSLPMGKKMYIINDSLFFQCNATVVLAKSMAAFAIGGPPAAAATAVAGLQEILGGAFSTAVAVLEIPGEAAVAATLGGAGEVAAAAAAAEAAVVAGGASALFSTFIVPVLTAGIAGAAVM